jgi:catechol 2,3-dioxygenase-like lactoylglutathione lyase family enzyme
MRIPGSFVEVETTPIAAIAQGAAMHADSTPEVTSGITPQVTQRSEVTTARGSETPGPLAASSVSCILPVKDMARARRFYEQSLGLVAAGAKVDGKFVYRLGATEIALFPRPEGTLATHTALSFRVADIAAAVRALERRGVVFADYDLPGLKTVEHVCVLGAEKAAWFSDPEGNILCLHEDIA